MEHILHKHFFCYKGSEDNRKAVMQAALGCENSRDVYGDDGETDVMNLLVSLIINSL